MATGINANRMKTAGTAPIGGGGKRRKIPKHGSVGVVRGIGQQPISHKKMGSL